MGIRETLNKNPAITTGATAAIILIAIGFIIYQISGSGAPGIATEAYYTIDDGKNWFADDINKIPPFEKDGKQAVKAYVYKCPGSDPFVSHLERYTPEGKKAMEAAQKSTDPNNPVMVEDVMMMGVEVKKPLTGDKGWVRQSNAIAAAKIMELKCPDGTTEGIEPVVP
ncbi:MAG TPA: hypothetical protein VGR35_18290 [Tepidisphaeraceae bacterium]|nr:hypothetical protein [Tepidisphaeraceae bacterium]